nr:unnamed protein product [Callosobruchus analis]
MIQKSARSSGKRNIRSIYVNEKTSRERLLLK